MMRALLALALLAVIGIASADHGKCGYQCAQDSDCGGCGSTGKCSCPDAGTQYPTISCSCVSQPANAPSAPTADPADATWPSKWSAHVDGWVYGDFTDKANTASGKFYYDGDGGHTRADWTPYTNQKDASQVWIGGTGSDASRYYVKSGPLCIDFPITDPGSVGGQVSVERADWMDFCNTSGFAKYVGREQIDVNGQAEWADHFSCHIEYTEVNQTITFQNWHSLGLGSVPKGLPLRVTGGNSAPNPTQGSPRLSTVWYSNFTVGNSSSTPSDFEKPSWFCIPVGADVSEAFFGHKVTKQHVFDPAFHRKAHAFPLHIAKSKASPTPKDLQRAVQVVPGAAFLGSDFSRAMDSLNQKLKAEPSLEAKPCEEFTVEELHAVQQVLFEARAPALQEVYAGAKDTRSLVHATHEDLAAEQDAVLELVRERPELKEMVRDGICHETVMWYTHHLSESTKQEVQRLIVLPLLPTAYHKPPGSTAANVAAGHKRYTSQVSCAVCHVA